MKLALFAVAIFLLVSAPLLGVSSAGYSWSIQTVDSVGTGWYGPGTSLALDSSGYPCISYCDTTNYDLKFARWTGSTWNIQTVDSAGEVGECSSLALDSDGLPCISYWDRTNGDLKFARWTGSAWNIQTVDSDENVGHYTSLALDSNDRPHISYFCFWQPRALKFARWTGSAWDIQFVDSKMIPARSSLAIDSSDTPCIGYLTENDTHSYLKFARWTGSAWDIQTLDSDLGLSFGHATVSLAFDLGDRPCMSYTYYKNSDLKFTRWTGSAWKTETVDSGGDCAGENSLALDSYDRPHISYCGGDYDLKYAVRTGSTWNIQIVDSAGDVGGYSSIALDSSGNPHISYCDYTTDYLKYAYGQAAPPTGSVTINSGDVYATSTTVNLTLTYTAYGATVSQVRYGNDGVWDTESWEAPAASKPWSLAPGDGTRTVYYQVKDSDGILSSTYWDTIVLDTTAPTGSIIINGGDAYTTSPSVMLSLTYSDSGSGVAQVRYSGDGTWDNETWQPPAASEGMLLTAGDGLKTVFYQVRDNAGLVSQTYSDTIILDTTPPQGSIQINNGSAYTNSTSVTLNVTALDAASGVAQVRFSNDGVWDTEQWENYSASKPWTLSSGDGPKAVFYQVRDNAGFVSSTYSGMVELDTLAPQGAILINNGAPFTNSTAVNLSLVAADSGSGVSQMRFQNNGSTWAAWEPYAASKLWSLSLGDGEKIVYVQYADRAGWTVTAFASIFLDATPPVANAGLNLTVIVGEAVVFDGSHSSDNMGIASYTWDFGDGSTGVGVMPTHVYSSVGNYNVTLMVKDLAGNNAASVSTVRVEVIIPEFPSVALLILFLMLASVIAALLSRGGSLGSSVPRKGCV